jgi:phosphoserine phosphatase RsbU/P
MLPVRRIVQGLGKSGIAFLIGLSLFAAFYFTGRSLLAFLVAVTLIPITFIVLFRGFKWVKAHALWSLRDRLLVVYTLIGVLPIALLFLLIGLSAWALMSELAIYLASSALDRRLEALQNSVQSLEMLSPTDRVGAVSHFADALQRSFPGIMFYFKDQTGIHSFPPSAPALNIPPGWGNVDGLLVWKHHFYCWAHAKLANADIAILAPLSNQVVGDLVPNLGAIGLLETDQEGKGEDARAGTLGPDEGSPDDLNVTVDMNGHTASGRMPNRIPPPMGRFDVPVIYPSTRMHYHLSTPGKSYAGVLVVESRPSAILRTFFSGTEELRGLLYDTVIAVAILFLLVELVAIWIGVRGVSRAR